MKVSAASLFCAALCACLVYGTVAEDRCKVADVAFVIDSSVSISIPDFSKEKDFVKALVKQFAVGNDMTRVSALKFSETAETQFYFSEEDTESDVLRKVEAITHTQGPATYIDRALDLMRTDLFANGARDDVPKLCILLTDGDATNKPKAQAAAQRAKDAGIIIIAVGIGEDLTPDELKKLVTSPSSGHYFQAEDFSQLESTNFQQIVKKAACKALPPPPPPPPRPSPTPILCATTPHEELCNLREADVVFVLDMSSSIYIKWFEQQLEFVSDVVSNFDVDSGDTQVAVVTFSDAPHVKFHLDEYSNSDDLRQAILSIKREGVNTNTHLALAEAQNMFSGAHGGRPDVAKICVLMTDGQSRHPDETFKEATALHDMGVFTFAIGVGNKTVRSELETIASKPSQDYTFQVEGFDFLARVKPLLTNKACKAAELSRNAMLLMKRLQRFRK